MEEKTNWLTKEPVNTWTYVYVSENRVSEFSLFVNNYKAYSIFYKTKRPDMLALMYRKEGFLHRLAFRSGFGNIFRNTAVPLLEITG